MGVFIFAAHADPLTLSLTAGRPAEVVIASPVDDTNFQDPRGYARHGSASRYFQRRLTLANTGTVPLTGRLLIINGQDWSSAESLRASLRLPAEPGAFMPRFFAFWRDQNSHANSGTEANKEPAPMLNFWGYGLCGETTASLTKLATTYGIPARKITHNGHVAAEYFYDNAWHVLDADQNVCYLRLDNVTLASAADIRADPFLARRTKVLGRHVAMETVNPAFNTSLIEFINPREEKPVKLKTPPVALREETLFPGEKLIFHADQAPERPVGISNLSKWGDTRDAALCVVELVIDNAARRTATGEMVVATAYPILQAVNHTTGETFPSAPGEPVFRIAVKPHAPDDRISVFCQRSRASLPRLIKGKNTVLLQAGDKRGTATLAAEIDVPEKVIVPSATATFAAAPTGPEFSIQADPGTDLIWWQIAMTADFTFIPPNFDAVAPVSDELVLELLTATFFNPGQPYFLRVKARRDGVWGEWSAPLSFRVDKPARPAPATVSIVRERLRLTWPDAGADCDYLVFGSSRLDFLPELFAADEIIALRDSGVEKSRPNKNLIATVTKPEIELEPAFRFYRIITRRNGVLSVPGDLITTPPSLAAKLPLPLVLQDRWNHTAEPRAEAYQHFATELPLH